MATIVSAMLDSLWVFANFGPALAWDTHPIPTESLSQASPEHILNYVALMQKKIQIREYMNQYCYVK